MTWDNTNLYIGITFSSVGEGAVIYLDKNPLTPINSGTNSEGTIVGFNYDGVSFAELQFRADLVMYVKTSYREYRTADGSGGWSGATSGFGDYNDNGSDIREFSIPWSVIGGRPSSFAWFGFVTSSGGFVYNQVPTENGGGAIGTSARYVRYYIVNSTSDAGSVKPFSRNSYVFNSTSDITGFGAITIYDFTVNTSGRSLTRAASGAWTINGSLVVNNGTLTFGSCVDAASVSKDVLIGSGGTLTLSSAVGGDLEVGGNWTNNGTFNCSERDFVFNGTASQTITGATAFDYFRINNAAGVSLNHNIIIDNRLKFDNGIITLGSNNLTLNSSAIVDGTPGSTKMLVCTGTGEVRKYFSGTGSFTFPVGDNTSTAEYSPVKVNFTSGTFDPGYVAVKLKNEKHPQNTSSTNYINRYWSLSSSGISAFSCGVEFTYTDADINGSESDLYCGAYNGSSWTLLNAVNAASNLLSGTVTGFSDFTGGEQSALPVELVSFTGSYIKGAVNLEWTTATEVNNYGFEIQRSGNRNQETGNIWEVIGFVPGNGNSNSEKSYSFTDRNIVAGTKYVYRLKQIDTDGSIDYSNEIEVITGVPDKYELVQNHPNPFNPTTSISYTLPVESKITLAVYSMNGEKVAALVNDTQPAGSYSVPFDASNLASGTYMYRITANDFVQIRKMLLVK